MHILLSDYVSENLYLLRRLQSWDLLVKRGSIFCLVPGHPMQVESITTNPVQALCVSNWAVDKRRGVLLLEQLPGLDQSLLAYC